jgi:hypothetical protein
MGPRVTIRSSGARTTRRDPLFIAYGDIQPPAQVPVEWEDAVVRLGVTADEAKQEIVSYVMDHPGLDALDIADGLQLGFRRVKAILKELEREGTLIAQGD